MSASAIGLHDDQVRLASIAIHSNDINALAEARVKRIADNDIVAMMMGSVLQVRRAPAKRISQLLLVSKQFSSTASGSGSTLLSNW
ncbi:hypothetical protein B0G80_0384 [Paraburkholderia sp. BL6669N2]|uniref:hypothetical protein n=1 Tax=Paraburkholderia sp. BL6669N2 TaxID=1938807 RepID=UPI000E2316EE|nr:hypothetical protein [Paraburkholderia sp. BL6669N2]REG57753.1 hypothetical protein B0G80_0384 [Paraburkholderia sp. BL6669N2]